MEFNSTTIKRIKDYKPQFLENKANHNNGTNKQQK